jgi:hypothetical protein
MNDAFAVRGLQAIGNLDCKLNQEGGSQGLPVNPVAERLALEDLHDEEGLAFVVVNIIDGADAGVIQGRGRASFALETLESLAVAGEFLRQEFQSDGATQTVVFGPVDNAHPSTAKFFDDAVV